MSDGRSQADACQIEDWFPDPLLLAGRYYRRDFLPVLPPRGEGLILDPAVPREGDASHPAAFELLEDRFASFCGTLDTAQFIALQNPARSVSFGHKRHGSYATTFIMPSSRGARLDAYCELRELRKLTCPREFARLHAPHHFRFLRNTNSRPNAATTITTTTGHLVGEGAASLGVSGASFGSVVADCWGMDDEIACSISFIPV